MVISNACRERPDAPSLPSPCSPFQPNAKRSHSEPKRLQECRDPCSLVQSRVLHEEQAVIVGKKTKDLAALSLTKNCMGTKARSRLIRAQIQRCSVRSCFTKRRRPKRLPPPTAQPTAAWVLAQSVAVWRSLLRPT